MTPDAAKAAYAATLKERVAIRRYTGVIAASSPRFEAWARARAVNFQPQEFVGAIVQGDSKVIVFADDLIEAGLALPVRSSSDRLVLASGKELSIKAVDDKTRRVEGVLIAYELVVNG